MTSKKIVVDDAFEFLQIGEEELETTGDAEFEIPIWLVKDLRLSDIPKGIGIRVCARVGGTKNELYPISPLIRHGNDGIFAANIEVIHASFDEAIEEHVAFQQSLDAKAEATVKHLQQYVRSGVVRALEKHKSNDAVYILFELILEDQPILDAHEFIDDFEEAIHGEIMKHKTFLCHASENKRFVKWLHSRLVARGINVWYDLESVEVGESIVDAIGVGLSTADNVIVVYSKISVKKPWVRKEIGTALMRKMEGRDLRILPVLLEDCEIPELLIDIRYADFRRNRQKGLDELMRSIFRKPDS